VQAVTGWETPLTIVLSPTFTEADYAREAREALDLTVAEAPGPESGARVEKHLVHKRPAHALTDAAEGRSCS
jgi:hypothetical protein